MNDRRKFFPKCDSEMVVKVSKKGKRAGDSGWACSGYPKCRNWVWIDAETTPVAQPQPTAELDAKREKTAKLVKYLMEKF